MAKLEVGRTLPQFIYDTPFSKTLNIADTVKRVQGKTALVFLRYYGCRICQYDMHQISEQYDRILETGGQLLIVLQSDPEGMKQQVTPEDPPYDIICDPDQRLYQKFEISPAASKEAMTDAKTAQKLEIINKSNLKHGKYEGNELQLPAVFIVTSDLELTYVHYGTSAGDVPTPEELIALLQSDSKSQDA